MAIKILHTADVHLGAKFAGLGEKSAAQRRELKKTFQKIIDLALSGDYQLFIIAGDLFDSNQASPEDLEFVKANFRRLAEANLPTCLIGGTHDFLGDSSVLTKEDWLEEFPNIALFDREKPAHTFDDLNLTVYGISNYLNKSKKSPLDHLEIGEADGLKIVIAHGSVAIPRKFAPDDFPIPLEQISALNINYLALGHWHSQLDVTQGATKAFYAGAPEPFSFDQTGAGNVLDVELDADSTQVTPIKVSQTEFKKTELDLSFFETLEKIKTELLKSTNSKLYYQVFFKGLVKPDLLINPARLEEDLADHFALLRIKDKSMVNLEDIDPAKYPDNLVIGKFVRATLAKIDQADDEVEKQVYQKSLQLGLALLSGGEL